MKGTKDDMSAESLDIKAIRERLERAGGPQFWRSLESVADTPAFQEFLHREFPVNASEWTLREPVIPTLAARRTPGRSSARSGMEWTFRHSAREDFPTMISRVSIFCCARTAPSCMKPASASRAPHTRMLNSCLNGLGSETRTSRILTTAMRRISSARSS